MSFSARQCISAIVSVMWVASSAMAEGVTVKGPATAVGGATIPVTWAGPKNEYDKVGIVAAGTPDGQKPLTRAYVRKSPTDLKLPEQPGKYEIRYLAGKGGATLARAPVTVIQATASVSGPATAVGGATISVSWKGPKNEYDKVGILPSGAPAAEKPLTRAYVRKSPTQLKIPEAPGEYEIRYLTGASGTSLASAKLTITGATASVSGPVTAVGGATISVSWKGPKNEYDKIGIVAAGAPDTQSPLTRAYARRSPTKIQVPEPPGNYEIRYLTGKSGTPLARAALTTTPASAVIEGPATAVAGAKLKVKWKGPANKYDRIVIAPAGAADHEWVKHGYVRKGRQLQLRAPTTAGPYELRYVTGQSDSILARAKLEVTPAKAEPGWVRVMLEEPAAGGGNAASGGAVEVILDTSGSMLQRLGSRRRFEVAVETLKKLTSTTIPAGTPFALRVFSRDADSCETTLEVPLEGLDAAAVSAKIASLKPGKKTRTPIAASLEAVEGDLRSVKGERLVILVTDGEETCGGDPAAAIEKLARRGVGVRVNIVGFAIDDTKLAARFRLWSATGGGSYFDARDAAGLTEALSMATKPSFEILDRRDVVAGGIVGDEPVKLMPGTYKVKLKGMKARPRSVTVRANETAEVKLAPR